MKFELIDEETDKSMWTFTAKCWEDVQQQVDCFLAENGIDREYDYNYTGHRIKRID